MRIDYPPELPVSERREEIAASIRDHQVVIVAGETGSGKTTQLPKICLELGRGSDGMIGHTQPRRIAARSVAERIAEELRVPLGETVGYQVRFTDRTSDESRVKVMTDGILLAELQHDRELRRYDTLIIDEAHERSLNIDFLLGYLRRLLPRRPDLKLIITSATIDPGAFSEYFGGAAVAPVLEVAGRTYPVELRYRPLVQEPDADEDGEVLIRDQTDAVVDAVAELLPETPGDVLVFLPGEREIRDASEALAPLTEGPRGLEVVPLFSRLSAAEQHRVFAAHQRRRVVLATNVAETSLTVPGITAVVDTGVARISRYSQRTKVQRLPIEPISQASARQRSGRCGRIGPGIAIRLYSEEDFETRPAFTDPEILRTGLASVILQMTSLRLGEVDRFGFLDPPDPRSVRSAVTLLTELGALAPAGRRRGGGHRLTATGRVLARLPIDPQLGRMLIEADRLGCLAEVLVITAALSVQDPRERPVEAQAQADQAHARFRDPGSDFVGWLNLWDHLRAQQRSLGSSAFRRSCRKEYLNHLRVREWQDFEAQLRRVVRQVGMRIPARGPVQERSDAVHQALLTGLLSHIGARDPERRDYLGARGARFAIFPGSGLFRKQPDFVVAAELVETSRLWARQCAAVDPLWVERAAGELVKRQYSEPHWSRRRAAAMARERVSLYGVPLVADRAVQLGRHDPELARELFLRHALVAGEWHARHRFLAENRRLLEEAEEREHRARRRDLVVDEETLFDFYDARVPAEVVSGAHFDTWWKQERRRDPDLLTFDPRMLLNDAAAEIAEEDFPDVWQDEVGELALSYRFEPGTSQDGVAVDVPVAVLGGVSETALSWQVPGLRQELVVALLRSLPKPLRVNFVPAPDVARTFLREVPAGSERITVALARHLRARTGVHVPEDAWDWSKVPAHLVPRIRVVDADGSVVSEGRDLAALKEPLQESFARAVASAAAEAGLERPGQTRWTFGTIPETFEQVRAGHRVRGFPGLRDDGDSVGLVVYGDAAERDAEHRRGLIALAAMNLPAVDLAAGLDNATKLALAGSPYPSVADLLRDCVSVAVADLVDEQGGASIREEAVFASVLARGRNELPSRAAAIRDLVLVVLERWRGLERELHGRVDLPLLPATNDLAGHLARLIGPGFVAAAGSRALRNHPRYLDGLAERLRRLQGRSGRPLSPDGDAALRARVDPFQRAWADRRAAGGRTPTAADDRLRWLIEEFRVSLWAQQLGTAEPVSEKRLRAALEER